MGNLTLTNLPSGGSVIIYNTNGVEVWSHEVGTAVAITWDGKNNQGSSVASGVYYAITKDASGSVVNRKPLMIVN
jgi:flagellar hook assembly protein FlgD